MLEWLADSDYETVEIAEMERRRNEDIILQEVRRASQDDHAHGGTSNSRSSMAPTIAPRFISGTCDGRKVMVCLDCCEDLPLQDMVYKRACCGRCICAQCAAHECGHCKLVPLVIPTSMSVAEDQDPEDETSREAEAGGPRTACTSATPHTTLLDATTGDSTFDREGTADQEGNAPSGTQGLTAEGIAHALTIPRPISIWDALGGDDYDGPPKRQPCPEAPLAHGHRKEENEVRCRVCARDLVIPRDPVAECACGAVRCMGCLCRPCPCLGIGWQAQRNIDSIVQRLQEEGTGEGDDGQLQTMHEAAWFGDLYAPMEVGLDHPAEQLDVVCTTCDRDLRPAGSTWRICRCGASICELCTKGFCTRCGAAPITRQGNAETRVREAFPVFNISDDCIEVDDRSMGHGAGGTGMFTDSESTASELPVAFTDTPPIMAPEQLLERRDRLINERVDDRRKRRKESHRERGRQIKNGLRPRRQGATADRISFITVNASAASTLVREIKHGTQLQKASFLFVQEHGLTDEALDRHLRELSELGWDGVATKAYRKVEGLGGGTAILSAAPQGVRPVCKTVDQHIGRITLAIANLGFDVLLISLYGVSGGVLAKQLALWKYACEWIRLLGIPFIIGGDLQVTPKEVEATRLCELIQGKIVAPSGPTTNVANRTIDMFIVSKGLEMDTQQVQRCMACVFKPHYPVIMTLRLAKRGRPVKRVARPRALAIERPIGPQLPGVQVNWDEWAAKKCKGDDGIPSMGQVEGLLSEWYAGAEAELMSTFGLYDSPAEVHHLGIGMAVRIVNGQAKGRFRNTDDKLGLIGHRLSWSAGCLSALEKAAPHVARYGDEVRRSASLPRNWSGFEHLGRAIFRNLSRRGATEDGRTLPPIPQEDDMLRRMGHHADALHRRGRGHERVDDADACRVLSHALEVIASMARSSSDSIPLIDKLYLGIVDCNHIAEEVRTLREQVDIQIKLLAARRKKVELEGTRRWAQRAPLAVAHRVTKPTEFCGTFSASAKKGHLGADSPQAAADEGAEEWGQGWGDAGADVADEILRTVEAMDVVEREYDDIQLPRIDEDDCYRAALQFKASTEVGTDWIRPRHVILLSRAARRHLGTMYEWIEKLMRWPSFVRYIVAVALSKKTGGSRLIGVATTIYRVWAKVRYLHCRAVLESRISRTYLAAAPMRGAGRAAFDLAFQAELAAARDEVTASTMLDMAQFYEHIRTDEYHRGGRSVGLPQCILSLTSHMYLGPRRIRVRGAVSRALYPAWSVLAGCTWATVHVRLLLLKPMDRFMKRLQTLTKAWGTRAQVSFYIDDGTATTSGPLNGVAFAHARVTDAFMKFVTTVLKKKIARGKIQCVASSRDLRTRLQEQLVDPDITVRPHGDFLGVDYSAGGPMTRKPIQAKRIGKISKRGGKIAWWRKLCGLHVKQTVRGGLVPSVTHGGHVHGIPSGAMKKLRTTQASVCKVRCGGSSVTARLAIGGDGFRDIDPAVLIGIPSLINLASAIWDEPGCRQPFTKGWLRAREEIAAAHPATAYRRIRGPIGASRLQLAAVGADWPAPFRITLLGQDVDMLTTPPLQLKKILAEHIRVHLDKEMIEHVVQRHSLDREKVIERYRYGIDWQLVRDKLKGDPSSAKHDLDGAERWALQLLVCDAIWPEARRWLAGYTSVGTCRNCYLDIGTTWHNLVECGATLNDMVQHRWAGRSLPPEGQLSDPAIAPLVVRGLPPRNRGWAPRKEQTVERRITLNSEGIVYGDGSAIQGGDPAGGIATWSNIKQIYDHESQSARVEDMGAGVVPGWFPTAPRSEILAYCNALSAMCLSFTYVGDCQHVIDIAKQGIPRQFVSSACFNADLWRRARFLLHDHGVGVVAHVKTKAHRSRTSAEAAGGDDPVEHWWGNRAADEVAKGLAKDLFEEEAAKSDAQCRERNSRVMSRVAVAAAFTIRQAPEADGRKRGRKRRTPGAPEGGPHELQRMACGGWACSQCKLFGRTTAALNSLRQKACRGEVVKQCHQSHALDWAAGFLFCRRCGAYTSRLPRALRNRCAGGPPSEAAANVLRRLRSNLPPTTADYAERVVQGERQRDETDTWDAARASGLSAPDACRAILGISRKPPPRQEEQGPARRRRGTSARTHPPPTVDHDDADVRGDALLPPAPARHGAAAALGDADAEGADVVHRGSGASFHAYPSRSTSSLSAGGPRAEEASTQALSVGVDAAASQAKCRRRIIGKTPPDRAGSSEARSYGASSRSAPRDACSSYLLPSWTRRVHIASGWMQTECTSCRRPTSSRCRACSAAICVACARESKPCAVGSST